MTGTKPFRPTPTQQRALDLMRSRHTGMINTGEGVTVTTVDILAREGLCTVDKSHRADGILRRTRFAYFEATLTDKGWEGHERPADPGPAYGEPTPAAELRKGDKVISIHTGRKGTWRGLNGLGSYTVDCSGAAMHVQDGHWRLLERAPEAKEAPAPAEEPSAPQEAAEERTARDSKGRVFTVGQRVTWRSVDGFLTTGEITGFGTFGTGKRSVEFNAETRQLAPPSRRTLGVDNSPGPARQISPPEPYRVALDSVKPA